MGALLLSHGLAELESLELPAFQPDLLDSLPVWSVPQLLPSKPRFFHQPVLKHQRQNQKIVRQLKKPHCRKNRNKQFLRKSKNIPTRNWEETMKRSLVKSCQRMKKRVKLSHKTTM